MLIRSILFLLLTSCSSLLYYPTHVQHYDPLFFGLNYKEGYIKSESGNELHYWHFQAEEPSDKLVVFFHGNAENLSSHFLTLSWLAQEGIEYVIFDYPGFFKSTGSPSPKSTAEAGAVVLRWFITQHPEKKIFIFGHSLGGIVALKSTELLKVEEQDRVLGIFLDGTFSSYTEVGASVLKKSWLTWWFFPLSYVVLSDRWAPQLNVRNGKTRFFVAHSNEDQVIDISLGKRLFEVLPEPKKWYEIKSGPHGSTFFVEKGYHRKAFLDFIVEP